MKLSPIVCLICVLTSFAANAENNVKLHGKITKPIADSISVRFNSDRIIYNPKTYETQVKSDGTFELTFPVVENFTELKLRHGNQQTDLVVASGDDMEITLDAEDFDASLHYSGKGSVEANFCALHERKSGELMNFGLHIQPLYVKEPADFEKSIDSLCQTELDFLNSNNKGLSTDFVKYWAAYFQYDCYAKKLVYPVFHEMRKQHTNHIDSISKGYYIIVSHVPEAFDDELLECSTYRLYLERLIQEKLNAAGVKNTYGSDIPSVKYKFADSVLTLTYTKMPTKTAEYTAAKHLYSNSKFETLDRSEEELKIFKSHFPESGYLPAINSAIAIQNKLDKGNNAIDFTIHTIDGKTMKLSDLKGKVVMIDFWASWCMPCVGEMPYANKIEEYYKDKDVVFLYISIDEVEDNWKKAIAAHHISGIHMRDTGAPKDRIAKLYGVEGVPAYFLIDKKGNFGVGNVPHPSDEKKLKAAIDYLLK